MCQIFCLTHWLTFDSVIVSFLWRRSVWIFLSLLFHFVYQSFNSFISLEFKTLFYFRFYAWQFQNLKSDLWESEYTFCFQLAISHGSGGSSDRSPRLRHKERSRSRATVPELVCTWYSPGSFKIPKPSPRADHQGNANQNHKETPSPHTCPNG